ncbi:MAG TPA: hypothetical protein VFE57_10260, partial [Cyclobacteriaceae bacterium]|nr:hypothetical protein [Cyclobacteriaceae bacterium]
PLLEGVDTELWKSDKYGCLKQRIQFISAITSQKDKLKSLNEDDIIDLLGRPDQNELYSRNQKFYRYFLEPGPSCEGAVENPKRLIIRFNAIGLAKEVSVE